MEAKKERLKRSQYSAFKRHCELLRMKKGVTMEEMALALGMSVETEKGTKKGQQARLSQYENRPDGPPWDIVISYADYFELEGVERFEFFMEALSPAQEITIKLDSIRCIPKEGFIKFLVGILVFERPPNRMGSPKDKIFGLEDLIKDIFPQGFSLGYLVTDWSARSVSQSVSKLVPFLDIL
jgi:transcriptional regulator with XRE-family HTH domain